MLMRSCATLTQGSVSTAASDAADGMQTGAPAPHAAVQDAAGESNQDPTPPPGPPPTQLWHEIVATPQFDIVTQQQVSVCACGQACQRRP